MTWTVPDKSDFIWKTWNDSPSWVVFDPRSRETHVLDELSAFVLRWLVENSGTIKDLVDRLALEFELDAEARIDAINYVDRVLCRFLQVGLIDKAST